MRQVRVARDGYILVSIIFYIAGILGVLIIVKPFSGIRTSNIIGGCELCAEGALNHLLVKETVKIRH